MKKDSKLGFSLIEISVVILIIGILIAAINTGTDLVKKSKTASAQNLTSNSPIYGMENLVLWFESSLPDSFYNEGDPIDLWSNNSPFYNIGSAVQETVANRPKYMKDSINHTPAVLFDDDTQFLEIKNIGNTLEESDLTIFILEERDADDNTKKSLISTSGTSGTSGLEIYYAAGTNALTIEDESGTAATAAFAEAAPALHYFSLNGGNNFSIDDSSPKTILLAGFNYYLNKRLPENGSMPAVTLKIDVAGDVRYNTGSMGTITIGAATYSYLGAISEILIFNRKLRQRELIDIFDYFEAKYNLSLSST